MDKCSFKELGLYLRKKRFLKNLSQADVGRRLGYRRQFIANWERGASSPPVTALRKLVDLYGISQREMLLVLHKIQFKYWRRALFEKPTNNKVC